ncbi:MAG: RNA methyltransferase [Clostridia bacterium]|nr:RNA methyltransferase [Clostridia bacterium]
MEITSKNNIKVTEAIKLNKKSYRDETGLFICDSWKMIYEFIENNFFEVEEIFIHKDFIDKYQEIINILEKRNKEILFINDQIMKKLSDNKSITGICCVFRKKENKGNFEKDFIIALDRVQDPTNVGAVLRSAAAFDIPVIISEDSADIYSPKTVKASMGGVSFDKIFLCENIISTLEDYKNRGYNIVSTALLEDSISIKDYDINKKSVIIIGNEGSGVRDEILSISDEKIIIPMSGNIQSLNASVAAGIIMWEKGRI